LQEHSKKKIMLASLAALGLALAQPMMLMSSMMFWATPIAIVVLYIWSGIIPAGVLSVGSVVMLSLCAGSPEGIHPALAASGAVMMIVLPGAWGIAAIEKKLPFSLRMAVCIAAQTIGMLLFACLGYLVLKIDLIDLLTASLRGSINQMPVDMQLMLLNMMSTLGIMTQETLTALTELNKQLSQIDPVQLYMMGYSLSAEQLALVDASLNQSFEYINYYLKQIMPALLIHSGMLTGVLMTGFSGWLIRCKNAEDEMEYIPLKQWNVPRRIMGLMLAGAAAGLVLQLMEMESSVSVTTVFTMLLTTLLVIQGMAALRRMFIRSGAPRGLQTAILIASPMMAPTFLQIAGALSALFGKEGAISTWMRKRMEESGKEDDDE